ncbi:hypothetical protein EGN72_00760 [Pseudorhodobacter sp. E13]|nr:hypothetical protein EGN72_00760 [Pseudorhodobacter sp. E13]
MVAERMGLKDNLLYRWKLHQTPYTTEDTEKNGTTGRTWPRGMKWSFFLNLTVNPGAKLAS